MSDDVGDELERIPTLLEWDRRPDETPLAYGYFAHYRDSPPNRRSLRRTAEAFGLTVDAMTPHSVRHEWVRRADAYSDYVEQQLRRERETLRSRANEAEYHLAQGLLTAVALRLNGGQVVETVNGEEVVRQVDRLSPGDMEWADVSRLSRTGVQIERTALGMPTDILRGSVGLSFSREQTVKLARGLFEIALRHMPDDRQARFAAEVEAFFENEMT